MEAELRRRQEFGKPVEIGERGEPEVAKKLGRRAVLRHVACGRQRVAAHGADQRRAPVRHCVLHRVPDRHRNAGRTHADSCRYRKTHDQRRDGAGRHRRRRRRPGQAPGGPAVGPGPVVPAARVTLRVGLFAISLRFTSGMPLPSLT